MTSCSRILRLPALVLLMTVVATCLSMLAAGSASAILPPCIDPDDPGNPRIVNFLPLSLHDCTISGNATGGPGGGVENYGTLDLTNVVISGNSADGGGGAIYNEGTLTLTNVVITGNTSLEFGGGILNDLGGVVLMSNVTVTGNTAGGGGGGIANLSGSIIGAGVAVANNTTTTGNGGGILNGASFCLSAGTDFTACFTSPSGGNSLVTGNHASAGNGGGIANGSGGVMTLSDSTVDGNHAEGGDGGGVWNQSGTTEVVNATISNNTASGNGGGVFNDSGFVCCAASVTSYATNLTIAGNRAGGDGGGVYTTGGSTILASATIADNTATGSGGGVFNDDASDAFTELKNTLLARNGDNCVGTISSDGNNLDTGATCALAGAGDQTDVGDANVGLRALAANGGPTQGSSELSAAMMTQALRRTSPAVDAGSATCPATDERGVPRPQDGDEDTIAACDIGAYELNPCLAVDKTCEVPQAPYVCTKPITSFTMQWAGTEEPIRIFGVAGVTPFDIAGIMIGDVVTVSGYDGSQGNDVIWNISFPGGRTGQSSFHLSCSDVDMNSADDCGKIEGNNKGNTACAPGGNNASCVNQWIFGGMTGPAGSAPLTCPGIATGDTACEVTPAPYVCTKPIDSLSMTWTGAPAVRIRAWKGAVGSTLLADIDNIVTGQMVTVTGYAGSQNDVVWQLFQAGTLTPIGIGNSLSSFHLSCSDVDMNGPEDCGKLEGDNKGFSGGYVNLWKFEGMAGAGQTLDCQNPHGTSPVTYRYTVTNKTSTTLTGINLTDEITDAGGTTTVPIAGPFDLGPKASMSFSAVRDVGQLTTNVATASNGICEGSSDTVTVSPSGGGQCATAGTLQLHDREVRWKVANARKVNLVITKITISWPAANGFLDEIKLDADRISKGNFNAPSTVVTTFEGSPGRRTITHGHTDTLKFKFQHKAVAGSYAITVEFASGCSVHIP